MRELLIIDNDQIENVIVVPDGKPGDRVMAAYKERYQDVIDVTSLDPRPGLGAGWSYSDGQLVPPPAPDEVAPMAEMEGGA